MEKEMGEDDESSPLTPSEEIHNIKPTKLHEPGRYRYGRIIIPTTRMIESPEQSKVIQNRKLTLSCKISEDIEACT